jgi:DNA-binding HxlR family transcriptional regulator
MWDPLETCGVNVAFSVVGSKWKPTIIWLLSQRARRFAELRRETGAVSEKVLAQQLRELQRDGIVSRRERGGFPLHVEYSLTQRGAALNDALDPVAEWAHQNGEDLLRARSEASAG